MADLLEEFADFAMTHTRAFALFVVFAAGAGLPLLTAWQSVWEKQDKLQEREIRLAKIEVRDSILAVQLQSTDQELANTRNLASRLNQIIAQQSQQLEGARQFNARFDAYLATPPLMCGIDFYPRFQDKRTKYIALAASAHGTPLEIVYQDFIRDQLIQLNAAWRICTRPPSY